MKERSLLQETILDNSAECLRNEGFNYTSQFGEDGFIGAALERLHHAGVDLSFWCFEVGAGDGRFYSNTRHLRDKLLYRAVLIESDLDDYLSLVRANIDKGQVLTRCRIEPTGKKSLDALLSDSGIADDPDLGVIDIDGDDYWCWKEMVRYRPKLMLVEYSPYNLRVDGSINEDFIAEPGSGQQTAINPLLTLGRDKGYVPLVQTFCNILFARGDVWPHSLKGNE